MTESKARSEMSRTELYSMIDELQETIAIVAERIRDGSLALSTPSEAVAWQVMLPGGHEGAIHRIEEEADAVAAGFKTAFVRPLYALSPGKE